MLCLLRGTSKVYLLVLAFGFIQADLISLFFARVFLTEIIYTAKSCHYHEPWFQESPV